MSKLNFFDGILVSSGQKGLMNVAEEYLQKLLKKEPISNVYIVEQAPFARGKFATVRKCTHRETNVEYAAKFIRKRRRAMDHSPDILHEVAVLSAAAGSSRIVALHEVYETPSEMALILELAAGGELQRILDEQEGLEELQAARFMKQILQGLSFLHNHNIAHLDLKPQNLLLTGEYPNCDIKLCDFGISRVIQNGVEVREILGTPDYVAPEVLSYEPISLATDIWSVGVLAYVLVSGFSPFGADTKQETFLNISKCKLDFPEELFQKISTEAQDFISASLKLDPRKRPSVKECLAHPWIASVGDNVVCIHCDECITDITSNGNNSESLSEECETTIENVNEDKSKVCEKIELNDNLSFNTLNIIRSFTHYCEKSCSRKTGEEIICNGNKENDSSYKDEEHKYSPVKEKENVELIINGHPKSEKGHIIVKTSSSSDATILKSGSDSEEEKDSPVNKRPKNCIAGRRSSYPIASNPSSTQRGSQCCHPSAPHSPDLRVNQHHSNITSPVETC